MAGKLKSYDLLTTSYFPVRPVFPVVFFFLKAIDRLKERGLSQVVPDFESVEEMDAKAALLRREGYL
jgi:hypothetical protein